MTTTEDWDGRIRALCEIVLEDSGASAVMLGVFAAPWMKEENGFLGTATGIAGVQGIDPRRMARELRAMADLLDAQAEKMLAGEPFEVQMPHLEAP